MDSRQGQIGGGMQIDSQSGANPGMSQGFSTAPGGIQQDPMAMDKQKVQYICGGK